MHPCRTPNYAATRRAKSNDIIVFPRSYYYPHSLSYRTIISIKDKSLTFLGLGGGITIATNGQHSFLHIGTRKSSSMSYSNITTQGIHFKNFYRVISLKTKHAFLRIHSCSFENISKRVIHIMGHYRKCKGLIIVEMHDSNVRNSSVYMGVNTGNNVDVTISRASFIGSSNGSERKARCFVLSSSEKGVNYTFMLSNSTFLFMRFVVLSRFQFSSVRTVLTRNAIFHFSNSIFKNNGHRYEVSINKLYYTMASFINVTFIENVALYGAAIYAESSHLQFRNCTFKNNYAAKSGGAVYLRESNSNFADCHFLQDVVGSTQNDKMRQGEGFLPGVGGAIVSDHCNTTSINHCYFYHNTAPVFGGAIFHMGVSGNLNLDNSVIKTNENSKEMVTGKAICSYSVTQMNKVTITMQQTNIFDSTVMIFGRLQKKSTLAADNATFKCPQGNRITTTSYYNNRRKKFTSLTVRCTICPLNYYSLHFGSITLTKSVKHGFNKQQAKCYPCPLGGKCQNGTIRSSTNFWGYATKEDNKIKFHACPSGYCCTDGECLSYNSCKKGRTGVLCGRCVKGATENLISSDCLPFRQCSNEWFYPLMAIAGISYVIFFLYVSEIGNLFLKIMNVSAILRRRDYSFLETRHPSTKLLTTSANKQYSQPDFESRNETEKYYFKGFIKTTFFFYQVKHLFMIYQMKDNEAGIVDLMEEKFSSMFNFDTEVLLRKGSLTWCPIPDMSAVTKQYIKLFFVAFLIILLLMIYFVLLLCRRVSCALKERTQSQNRNPGANSLHNPRLFNSCKGRIVCAGLNIIILGYAKLTKTLLSSLNCVSLGRHGKVLFLQGDIACYQPWQYIAIGTAVVWIIPFPFIITMASNLLEQKKISVNTFFASLMVPLPYLVKWLLTCKSNNSKIKQKDTIQSTDLEETEYIQSLGYHRVVRENATSDEFHQEDEEEDISVRIFATLNGPFRSRSNATSKSFKWESVLIGSRLILIFLCTFIINAVIRIMTMLVATCTFLVHHVWVMPFKSKFLNALEIFFLSSLCILCMLNIFPAYQYTYPTKIPEGFQTLSKTFRTTDLILSLAVPAIFVVITGLFLTLKILVLLWKILKMVWGLCKCLFNQCR